MRRKASPSLDKSWWRHQMDAFFAWLALCAGNSTDISEFPSQRPSARSLMFSMICAWINSGVNNLQAGDLRHHRAYYDVIVISWWRHQMETKFPRNLPFVRGIHRSPVNSSHKGQWRWALMFSLICVWINGWVNNREAGDLRRYRVHYDVIVIF